MRGVYTLWACIGSACGSLEESGVDGLGFRGSVFGFGVLNLQLWVEDGLCLGAMAMARQSTGLGRYCGWMCQSLQRHCSVRW